MASTRVNSIDLFRAVTMLMMLFVNDFAGMDGIPHWMCHAETNEDMMGLSDLVFPAFIFCMGLSIPFAISSRQQKGESILKVGGHILLRSIALIVMGLFSMNCSSIDGVISHQWFSILMVIGFFMVWNTYPKASGYKKGFFTGLKIAGVLLLVGLFALRITNGHPIVPSWWGILGLLGWAYLFSCIVYIPLKFNSLAVLVGWFAVIVLTLVNNSGISVIGSLPGGWTHVGICFTGVAASTVLMELVKMRKRRNFSRLCLYTAAGMFVAGVISHFFWINSKNLATPTWMFFSLCVSFVLLALFYYLEDVKKIELLKGNIFEVILRPAGTCTLTCYMLPSLTYAIRQLLHLYYPHFLSSGLLGLVKAFVFALVIITVAGVLSRFKIKLKL